MGEEVVVAVNMAWAEEEHGVTREREQRALPCFVAPDDGHSVLIEMPDCRAFDHLPLFFAFSRER